MGIQKPFVVKNGLEVNDNLIYADADTNRVGIATTNIQNTLHVNGGIGATDLRVTGVATVGNLVALQSLKVGLTSDQQPASTTGTVSASSPAFVVGVNTSLFKINDIIGDGPGGFLGSNRVTSIGINSIGISPTHTLLVGSISTTILITREASSGDADDVLASRGDGLPPIWKKFSSQVLVSTSSSTSPQYPLFSSGVGFNTGFSINQNQLSFIPSSGNLGLGTTNPTSKLSVFGNISATGNIVGSSITSTGSIVAASIASTGNIVGSSITVTQSIVGSSLSVTSARIGNVTVGIGSTTLVVNGDLRVTGIATFGTSTVTIDGNNNRISIGTIFAFAENQIGIGTAYAISSSGDINAGIITARNFYGEFAGTATTSLSVNVSSVSSTTKYYPTFVSGIGSVSLGIATNKLHFIPSSGNLGIGTTLARYNVDVVGSLGIDGYIYAPTESAVYENSRSASIDGTNRGFVSISTSGVSVGDIIDDAAGSLTNRIPSNTTITSIGIGSVGISNLHGLLAGTESINVSLASGNLVSEGKSGYILVSGGSTLPTTWRSTTKLLNIGVTTTSTDDNFKLIFTSSFGENTLPELRVDESGIVYNPAKNNLGIGSTVPTVALDVIGDAKFTGVVTATSFSGTATTALNLAGIASTATNVIGGIASVTQLRVSGVSTFTSGVGTVTINNGTVTATEFLGSGASLAGIVTQVTAGIGINLTPTNGKGKVEIQSYTPTGKTIYVKQTGNDNNTGLSENHAKKTIKAAAQVAVFGDTIKVYPGVYVEENPVVLKKTVSVEGTELRNCVVTPKYPYLDLFHVNNGCHITDISFIGPDMTDGASVVALQPLEGVAVDRYFDAARMIRLNLDYIAAETVGYLTSTSYKNPAFEVVNASGIATDPVNCKDDIKDIWKCIIHDITRGGNSKCVGAGLSYYTGDTLVHIAGTDPNGYSVRQATVDAIDYSFGVARAIVNNVSWGGTSVGVGTTVVNAFYNEITGVTTITAINHGLSKDDAVRIVGLGFTCPSGPGIVTYPSGSLGYIFNVNSVIGVNTFEVVVGQSTLPHTYVSGGTIEKYTGFQSNFYQVKDLSMQKDPLTGFNNAINGCANVISAMRSCVGVVTSIVGLGSTAFTSVGIRTTYPGNSGIGFTTVLGITSAVYDEQTGKTTIIAPGLNAIEGEPIELRGLNFSCSSGGGISTQAFPSGRYGFDFFVDKINTDGSFEVYVGPSTLPHSYVGGGVIVDRAVGVTTATYDNTTGITTITATGLSIETGDLVRIRGLEFSCPSGSGTTTIYPTGNNGYDFRVLNIITDKPYGITSAVYDNTTGITTITAPGIGVTFNDIIELRNLEFSCPSGAGTTTLYPTGNNGYDFRVLSSIGSTFIVNVGPSTIPHNYVSGGTAINRTKTAGDTFTINVGPSTIPHTYVSGGIAIPPFSRGVGPITQGPYVRNCTNFIPKSIGMKIDGFAAEPGDRDDIGVTGTMSVDSYTQYNQGGIGVSITNGAYAQLVSIFTICDDIAIFTGSGGQCDITNSNSSFGRLGLVSVGVGDAESKSIYRSTGVAATTGLEKTNQLVVSGVGSYRPYDGQVCYFGELYYFVDTIEVTNGGSGYTAAPRVTISSPEGANGITAQATATIENGSVVAINIVNSGTQYRKPPIITIDPPVSGTQATARATKMQPIYYKVDSATLPSAGISTISFLQTLNNTVSAGTTVYFTRVSLQITSSHSFEWVGSGNDINTAKPALGGVVIPENEVVQDNGGIVVYTSTDQAGNFKIGDGVVINQATGQITGRDFTKALFVTLTPFILALAD